MKLFIMNFYQKLQKRLLLPREGATANLGALLVQNALLMTFSKSHLKEY